MSGKRYNLNKKLVIGTIVGVMASILVFISIFSVLYKKQLYAERENAVEHINQLFYALLKKTMLNNQKDELNRIIAELVKQNSDLSSISILSSTGKVAFSNKLDSIGSSPESNLLDASATYQIIPKADDKEILRKITTVYTENKCTVCHKPIAEQPIRGYIMVDYDVSNVRDETFKSSFLLIGSGAFIVLINIFGGIWFIRRFVLNPVGKIAVTSKKLADGNLDARVTYSGNDELSDLAGTFNLMGQKLQEKIKQLDDSKNFLQNLVDTFPDGICIINKDFEIILSNRVYKDKHKTNAKTNKCYVCNFQRSKPCVPTMITCPVVEIAKTAKGFKTIQQHVNKDGDFYYVEVNAMPMQIKNNGIKETLVIEAIRDFSSEVKYSHETRLAEFGMLAYGIAHEILNPLSTIKFALHSCLKNKGNQGQISIDELLKNIRIIDDEVGACIEVTDRLLKLSTKPYSKAEMVSVKHAVLDTLSLLEWEAKNSNITIESKVSGKDSELTVLGSDSDLRVVTLNLAQNAFHAMPEGGRLTVSIEPIEDFIKIVFKDTGHGINPEHMKEIFYPFYSKRADSSHGTGLGLAICKNIINSHNGSIEVDSVQEQGSTFTILLPRKFEEQI